MRCCRRSRGATSPWKPSRSAPKVRKLIAALKGGFGKVMADLIAEGQSEPAVLRDLFDQHVSVRRAALILGVMQSPGAFQ
jgi:hypothetical protein